MLALLLGLFGSLPAAEAQTLVLPQRSRATGPVIFYAAPNGSDANNTCLDAASPCTPQGAYVQAKVNWDFAGPIGRCFIKLARGTYTVPPSGILMDMAGVYVGYYMCQVSGDVNPPDFHTCIDANTVVIDIPNGGMGFYNKDGIITVFGCLTLRGANNATGIGAQQANVIDISDVVCGPIPTCISASTTTAVNINGPLYFGGDMTTLFAAGALTQIKVWYQQIVALRQLSITYLAQAYGAGASIEFLSSSIANPTVVNPTPQCVAYMTGVISYSGFNLPCSVSVPADGKFYP
jgi:hypothetical protein